VLATVSASGLKRLSAAAKLPSCNDAIAGYEHPTSREQDATVSETN
jgi:hypothetical protein